MLKNFNPEFTDLTDYILKITHRIWEERGVDRIRDWYGAKAPVYTPMGVTQSVDEVIRFTLQTLHMFPDRQLYGEDVIGRDYSQGNRGLYYSSHRILSTMTHRGDGLFGEPTGRKTVTRVIADCVCEKNQVIEEWMVRDQSIIVKDLGLDVEAFGRAQGQAFAREKKMLQPKQYVSRWQGGPQSGKISGYAQEVAEVMEEIFGHGKVRRISDSHDRAASCYFPQVGTLGGVDEISDYMVSFLSSFDRNDFKLHHWIERQEAEEPVRISLRWTLMACHNGYGLYGPPSKAPLTVMGISHFELRKGKIYRAFHLFDELSIWAQIEINAPKK